MSNPDLYDLLKECREKVYIGASITGDPAAFALVDRLDDVLAEMREQHNEQ